MTARSEVRSLVVNKTDSTDVCVNLSEEMRITFEEDFIRIMDRKICMLIALDEISSWHFNEESFDVMVNVEEVKTSSLIIERTPAGLMLRNDDANIDLKVYDISGLLVKHYQPACVVEMPFCDFKSGLYLLDIGNRRIKILIQ